MSTVFKGRDTFDRLVARAERENWRALPIGERTVRVGLALAGTPYMGYTLEIDNRVEAPSVDFRGLDCWTFFEISLGFARMLHAKPGAPTRRKICCAWSSWTATGTANAPGQYLSRIHFLEELFYDNEKRGLLTNITPRLDGAERMDHRDIREMTVMWRHYRYLRNNPSLLPEMARIQERVSDLPVYQVPKQRVPCHRARPARRRHHRHHQPRHRRVHLARGLGLPGPERACCAFCTRRPNKGACWWTTGCQYIWRRSTTTRASWSHVRRTCSAGPLAER